MPPLPPSRSRRRTTLAAALVLVLAAGGAIRAGLGAGEDTVSFAGMQMTSQQMDDMVRDSMGADDMSDVRRVGPDDRRARLEPKVVNGVKEFELSAEPLRWEYRNRQTVAAWGYNGQVPGPAMHVTEGDRVRITFTNDLPEPTTVHWHGVDLPYEQDGVPGVSQEPVAPGATFTYEFEAKPAGTRFYHTHGSSMRDEARQLDMGLAGALIIEPKQREDQPDRDYTLVLDEWGVEAGGLNAAMMSGAGHAAHDAGFNLFTLNGRAAPDFEPLEVREGERVRIRLINAGSSTTHPMHLHGHQFTVTAMDGNPVPKAAQQRRNVLPVAPGETYDIEFLADNPGTWMLHCHELHHADGGMMTVVQYEGVKRAPGVGSGGDASEAHGAHEH